MRTTATLIGAVMVQASLTSSRQTDTVEEAALLAALQARHEWAFEVMIRTYGGRLLAVARRICGNEMDAQDAVQSAYLSAFRSIDRFEGHAQLSTWLHRIVVNTALMKLRSQRRKQEESIEALLPAFREDGRHAEHFSDWSATADQLLEQKRTRATVRACIDRLPENYRTVVILRDIEELTTNEVAELLTMTPTAVKVRLHRARQALATLLRTEYAMPGSRAIGRSFSVKRGRYLRPDAQSDVANNDKRPFSR